MDEPEESYPPSHGEATKAAYPPKFVDQPETKSNSSKDLNMQSTKAAAPVQPQPPLQREDQIAQQQHYTAAQTRPRITHPKLVASKAPCFPSAPFLFCEDEPIELPAAPCNSEVIPPVTPIAVIIAPNEITETRTDEGASSSQ